MEDIWAEIVAPSIHQPWWLANIMMQDGDLIWRHDTIVDTEQEHLVRRVQEEIDLLGGKSNKKLTRLELLIKSPNY
jgi:hypothetical protein